MLYSEEGEVVLVHGTLTNPQDKSQVIGHAWIEAGDKVYDPVMDVIWPKDAYYRFYKAVPERTYSRIQAVRFMRRTKHFGPWHRTAGAVDRSKSKQRA